MEKTHYSRRRFIHLCGGATTLLANSGLAADPQTWQTYGPVRLINSDDRPIRSEALDQEREYVFFYPFISTPCFLINLAKPTEPVDLQTAVGTTYRWHGGIGKRRSVVAFAAICSHKLTHPSGPVSFIGYRQKPVGFLDPDKQVVRRGEVIQCCSEHSIYDPASGARVLAGPAPQPLASIALEEDEDGLYATGVYGGALYQRFFERFGFRLQLEFGEQALALTQETAQVMPIEEYTQHRVQC